MLYWSYIFFVLALVAGIVGFGDFISEFAGFGKLGFFIFLALFFISLIMKEHPDLLEED